MSKANGDSSSKSLLSADDIFAGGDEKYREVVLKGVSKNGADGVVYIRHLPAEDMMIYHELLADSNVSKLEQHRAMIRIVASAVVDPNGEPIFAGRESDLGKMPVLIFNQLSNAVLEMSGLMGATGSGSVIASSDEGKDSAPVAS